MLRIQSVILKENRIELPIQTFENIIQDRLTILKTMWIYYDLDKDYQQSTIVLVKTDYVCLRRLKDFLRRNFGAIAFTTTVVGGLAGLVITIVSFVRSSAQPAAKGASNASKKTWDFVKKVGAILAPILTALATSTFMVGFGFIVVISEFTPLLRI